MAEMTAEEMDELWKDLLDCIEEVRLDLKGNRRGLRHLRSLEMSVRDINAVLGVMAQSSKGRKFLR